MEDPTLRKVRKCPLFKRRIWPVGNGSPKLFLRPQANAVTVNSPIVLHVYLIASRSKCTKFQEKIPEIGGSGHEKSSAYIHPSWAVFDAEHLTV